MGIIFLVFYIRIDNIRRHKVGIFSTFCVGCTRFPMDLHESSQTEWVGYHGTSMSAANSILKNNYNVSNKEYEWLGHGAYFFIDGLNDPTTKAAEWAKFRSWDNDARSRKYTSYAVLQSKLSTDRHLDLDDVEDLQIFEALRERCHSRMRQEGFRGSAMENDCYLSNFAMQNLGLDALVRRECIHTRPGFFKSRIPNCRILCLKEPEKRASAHQIVKRGNV